MQSRSKKVVACQFPRRANTCPFNQMLLKSLSSWTRILRLWNSFQVAIIAAWLASVPISVLIVMPDPSVKYVELTCLWSHNAFLTSTVYNIILLAICLFFSSKIRTWPNNSNEARFVNIGVTTELITWAVIIPTYVFTEKAWHMHLLLAGAILVHSYIVWLFMFAPKLHAMYAMHAAQTIKPNIINVDPASWTVEIFTLTFGEMMNSIGSKLPKMTDRGIVNFKIREYILNLF